MTEKPAQNYVDIVTQPDGSWAALPPGHEEAVRKLAAELITNRGAEILNGLLPSRKYTREYAHTLVGAAIAIYSGWVIHEASSSTLPLWMSRLDTYIRYYRRIAP